MQQFDTRTMAVVLSLHLVDAASAPGRILLREIGASFYRGWTLISLVAKTYIEAAER